MLEITLIQPERLGKVLSVEHPAHYIAYQALASF
jgi:hypothetical protein